MSQRQIHHGDRDRGQEQPFRASGLRMHKTVDVEPLIAGLHDDTGTAPFAHPDAPQDGFEADAVFVYTPQFDFSLRMLLLNALYLVGKVFLKAACCSASALA
jgi:hypothetical protein